MKYEQMFKQLEEIVAKLENGNLPLDQSMALFEKGVRLSAQCANVLDEAQKKVDVLIASSGEIIQVDEEEIERLELQ